MRKRRIPNVIIWHIRQGMPGFVTLLYAQLQCGKLCSNNPRNVYLHHPITTPATRQPFMSNKYLGNVENLHISATAMIIFVINLIHLHLLI